MTGEEDPQSIDINTLFVLLTLTSQGGKLQDKLDAILKFICFETHTDGETNMASLEEAKYIFQICYQLLSRVTDLDLGDQDTDFGSYAESELVQAVFGEGEK